MVGFLNRRKSPPSARPLLLGGSPFYIITLLLRTSSLVSAQLYTNCDPLRASCPPIPGLSSPDPYEIDFTTGPDDTFFTSVGHSATPITYSSTDGATFTVAQSGDNPSIESDGYLFFGTVEVHLRAAPGRGIVSCVVLQSDDLDEIDWEWLGGVEERHAVQTNWFGRGVTGGYDRGRRSEVGFDVMGGEVHNYTIDWDRERIVWVIDGEEVRRVEHGDVKGGDNYYPQTPVKVRLGAWAGGDKRNPEGTREWAGGETDYEAGPFVMAVERVRVVNKYPAVSYLFGDASGNWESVVSSELLLEELGVVVGGGKGGANGNSGATGGGSWSSSGSWGGGGGGGGHGDAGVPGSSGTGGTRDGPSPSTPTRPNGTPVVNLSGSSSLMGGGLPAACGLGVVLGLAVASLNYFA